jgi:hypothetical protein
MELFHVMLSLAEQRNGKHNKKKQKIVVSIAFTVNILASSKTPLPRACYLN